MIVTKRNARDVWPLGKAGPLKSGKRAGVRRWMFAAP
jgi:hypothetical protein